VNGEPSTPGSGAAGTIKGMDSPESSSHSSLDSLRTVEFRQTLRGYHIDEVDEYLERVAVDVEALKEQVRVAGERLRQAAERIATLEQQLDEAKRQPAQAVATAPSDEALHRTLQMAQRFVEQTRNEAVAEAEATVADARQRATEILTEAEANARRTSEEAQRQLREDVARLEQVRGQLSADVETMARHLEGERARLRAALGELTAWVDEKLQPAAALLTSRSAGGSAAAAGTGSPRPAGAGGGSVGDTNAGRPAVADPTTNEGPARRAAGAAAAGVDPGAPETALLRTVGPGAGSGA
jgi:cell division initiation protein